MKTQIKRFSKSALAVVLTLCMLVSCMTVGIIATDAAYDNSERVGALSVAGYIYFIKPSDWTYASLMVGHSYYSRGYNMSNISGTNLYYVNQSAWSDSTEFAFFDVNNWGEEGSSISHRAGYAAHSSTVNSSYAMNSGSTYLIATTANSPTYYSAGYSAMNAKLTVKTMLKSGSSYAETTTKCGTFSATNGKKLNGNGSSTSSSISQTNGTATLETARTNTATISQSAVSGYTFKGWKTSKDTTGSGLSSGDYSFTNSGSAATVYAYYEPAATNYTGITAVAKGTTDGTNYSVSLGTIQSSTTVSSSTGLSVSAPAKDGYTFSKWVASGSGTFDNANNASTKFHPAASSEVATAQYKRSYSVTKNSPSNGTITLSKSSGILAGETFKVTLAPSSGYRVATFTVDNVDKKSSLNSSNEYTHTATGTGNSFEVNATFEAIPATTIYIKKTMPTYNHFYAWNSANTTAVTAAWTGDQFTSWSTTSDGKYYYKSYTWNCAGFKFILNDNSDSNKTTDSAAYDTGKSYYIDSATNNKAAVLTEGVPTAKAITYTSTYSSDPDVNWGGTKPATAYPGEEVSFTVSAKTGYKLTSVTYTPAGGSATTISATSGTYKFTMPAGAVTVTANTVKQYTVTLTAGTGFDSKKYKVGSGTQQTYSSEITVDSGSNVVFDVTYTTGYEYDSDNSTLSGAVASNSNKTFTLSNVSADTIVTLAAKKITWSGLTAVGKYTEDGTNYNKSFSTNPVSIASTSATQLDGTTVTAPATVTVSGVKYNFVDFVATNGSVTNAATSGTNKTTTFKPSAASAVCTARYKKVYTITSSVDDTGTGAGTVSTNKTEVEAGGSYTITATAKSGSAIESVTVNNTSKGTNATTEVSGVSANQTVSVKFASKPHVIGKVAAAGWTEPGDAMKSNAAGTEFTFTRTELAAGTYDFQHYIGTGTRGTYDSTSTDIATKTISGGATLSSVDNGYEGKKFQLVLTAKSDVTLVSNGSKFTAITVRRSGGQKYNVTFKKVANTTITGTYLGTPFTTASADAVVEVYSGDDINFTVTPDSDKYISGLTTSAGTLNPAFAVASHGNKYEGKTNVTSAITITPTVGSKLTVSAKTNKSDRGTVTVDNNTAYPGQIVKVTVTPKNGVLKSLTVKDASGADVTLRDSAQTSSLNYSQLDVATVTALMYDFFNKSGEALGAAVNDEAVGADTVKYFTMPNSSVTVSATFDPYSAESTWYYNGYDTSGNAVSGYHARQMTEAMVGGEKFSYYHVEGRTGTDQLMTVSNGAASSGTRYVYFTALAEGGWSTDENHQYAYFYNTSGAAGNAWPGYKMTKYTTNDYGQKVYRVEIPTSSSPTGVVFNNSTYSPHQTTNVTDLSKGGYYLLNTSHWDDTLQKTIHDWQSYDCTYPSAGYSTGTEYFYKESTHNGDYTGDFNTKGFHNHKTASKEFAKPKDLGTNTGDYYINVLYPNTTYTINGVTKKTGTNPMIIWSAEPLAGDDETVKIYAKDGAIRAETFGSTYANIADTKIYAADGSTTVGTKKNGRITNQTYETYKADKGETIVIKTTIGATDTGNLTNAAALKAKYYVRGFCVNGEVSELLEWNANGLYTLTYKVPENYEGKNIEITPIYYLKDTSANPIVTYRVTGFTDALKAVGSGKPGWGDTLYTYPFYGKLGGQNNAFGAYPGQPMVYYKGQYQMQIPQKSTAWDIYYDDSALSGYSGNPAKANAVANTPVSGVTMSNGYWDIIHRQIMGYGDNSKSADHVQTYDYGDFYKIFNEKKPVDNIVFDFKYRTKKHNFENQPAASTTKSALDTNYGTNGNGFELLTNFHGRTVDLFGTPLSGEQLNATPVYVVSIGGVDETKNKGVENIAGYYATEWMVYGSSNGTDYNRITDGKANGKSSIPPEVLVLNDDDDTSFNKTTYPSADANHNVTDWKDLYHALEAYRGKPVMISYEAADAQQAQGMYYTGTGGATRNDGRWLYSKNGENITSKIKIQYSNDNGKNYNDLNTTNPQVKGLSAYFTNDGVEGQMTYSTTIDPDKTFDFEAKTTNADYKFVGWFMEDGTKITTDNSSYTERSGSYTFVAKFMQVTTGQLMLSHIVEPNNIGQTIYDGTGTVTIAAVVKNGEGEIVRTFDATTSDIILDDKIIKSDNSAYTIEVTLTSTRGTNSGFVGASTMLKTPSDQSGKFFNYGDYATSADGYTHTFNLSFTVGDLFSDITQQYKHIVYQSYFQKYVFNYTVNYEFKDRFGNKKIYNRAGTLTAAQAEKYVYKKTVGNDELRYIKKEFFEKLAPYESNFQQNLSWNISDTWFTEGTNYVYNCNAHYSAIPSDTDNKVNVTFVLPYVHDNGVATLNNGVGTAAESTNYALINDGTNDNRVAFATIPKLTGGRTNGIYSADDGEKQYWIAAPTRLDDGKYFSHWSIKTTDSNVEVASCYFPGFNFLAYENYVIEAVYGRVESDVSKSGIYTNATYLSTTRNQWNALNSSIAAVPDVDKTDRATAADVLYNDFVLNYHYNDVDIYKNGSDASDIKELGVVVERVKELDKNSDESYDTRISSYTSLPQNIADVKRAANSPADDGKAQDINGSQYYKQRIAKKDLDNKNRIQFFEAFYNAAGWDSANQKPVASYKAKRYVYRAYTYIKYNDNGDEKIAISETPAYFVMYDVATANYSSN